MSFIFNPFSGTFDAVKKKFVDSDLVNGSFKESFDALIVTRNSDTEVWTTIEQSGGGDLTCQFSSGLSNFDCTGLATPSTFCEVELTVGSDASPTANYVYVLQSAPTVLTVSTVGWPATEHIKVLYAFIPSAAHVLADGAYINQNWNDHLMGSDNMGHLLHIAERSRRDGAYYFSGIDANGTSDYLTIAGTTVDYKATSGVIYQMHKHTFPAVDTSASSDCHVVNWSGDAYHEVTNLYDIIADSGGNSLTNKWFSIVVWGVANKTGEYEPTMINLPSGGYTTQGNAETDADGYANFSIPRQFGLDSSTGFLIAKITVRRTASTWTYGSYVDLRGQTPTSVTGGTSGALHNFADNQFTIFDEIDTTKILDFDVGTNVSSGNTRTVTIPDEDTTLLTQTEVTDLTDGNASTAHKHDHGGQDGLTDDDHVRYVDIDGTRALTGNWDVGNFDLTMKALTMDGDFLLQSASDSVTAFQVLDNDGGVPVFNVDTTNERVGVGIAAPEVKLHVYSGDSGATPDGRTNLVIENSGDAGFHILVPDTDNAVFFLGNASDAVGFQFQWQYANTLGIVGSSNAAGELSLRSGNNIEAIRLDASGNVGISAGTPLARLHVDQKSSTGAVPVLLLEQKDYSEECILLSNNIDAPVDQDIVLMKVDVTGTPTMDWDESEDEFSFNKGLSLTGDLTADGDFLLQSAIDSTTALQVSDNDGGNAVLIVDTANERVGIGTSLPINGFHVRAAVTGTTNIATAQRFEVETSADMIDGLGVAQIFVIKDDAEVANVVGKVGAKRDGADNEGALLLRAGTNGNEEFFLIKANGDIGMNKVSSPLGQLHIDQSGSSDAQPVLYLDQADVSEEFIKFVGTAAGGDVTQSIVDNGDVATATLSGWLKVEVEDKGNQIADQAYYQPLYTLT